MDFRSDQFTIAGTEYQGGVVGAAQGSGMEAAKGLALKAGLHVRRKHKHKCKHKHKVVYTCDKHKHEVTYAGAVNKYFGDKVLNPNWRAPRRSCLATRRCCCLFFYCEEGEYEVKQQ